ncbi:MAG: DUF1553 domain-containing protein, partial [Verrucomicrobiota bacterium]
SGQLSAKRGGPTFKAGLTADYGFNFSEPQRSVYVPVFRNALPEIFEVFDFADPSMVVGARNSSTVAPQALFLMNHPFVRQQASSAVKRLFESGLANDEARIDYAYRLVLGRKPSQRELALVKNSVAAVDGPEAWVDLFHALFASAEFRYVN